MAATTTEKENSSAVHAVITDYLGNLMKKSAIELQELLERQDKLLANKSLIQKLPDKGAKIKQRRDEIKKVLDDRENDFDATANLFSELRISSDEKDPEDIENAFNRSPNVFETLASNEATATLQKKVIDFNEDKSFYSKLSNEIDEKFAAIKNLRLNKPKTTTIKQGRKSSEKNRNEESNVIYPVGPHPEAILIPLSDSMHLQKELSSKIKDVETTLASQKLQNFEHIKMSDYIPDPVMKMNYREVPDIDSDLD